MRRFLVPALLLFSISGSWADAVQRAPVNIDYADFLKNADSRCNSCQLLLTGRADRSHPSSLVYVRAKREKDGATEIQAGYFEVKNANLPSEGSKTSLTDYLAFGIAPEKLKESQTSNFYTGEALRSIATNSLLMKGTTAIVSRVNPLEAASPTPIDTSILIRNAGNADFIVEQASDIPRFARNLALVRDRRYSQQVTLFDFTPRSRAAMKQMELDGTVLPWRFFSRRISGIFYSYQNRRPLVEGRKRPCCKGCRLQRAE